MTQERFDELVDGYLRRELQAHEEEELFSYCTQSEEGRVTMRELIALTTELRVDRERVAMPHLAMPLVSTEEEEPQPARIFTLARFANSALPWSIASIAATLLVSLFLRPTTNLTPAATNAPVAVHDTVQVIEKTPVHEVLTRGISTSKKLIAKEIIPAQPKDVPQSLATKVSYKKTSGTDPATHVTYITLTPDDYIQ